MPDKTVNKLVEDATYDFALGENEAALEKLTRATEIAPESFEAWHALTEVYFSMRKLEEALAAGNRAEQLQPDDIHIHTSLSRIHMERGDKATAEKYGAQARMLGWKKELGGENEEA